MGNLQTLKEIPSAKGIDIREELLKFHHNHYSSNKMKLVVLGKESLDTLKELVTSKFSDILNKNYSTIKYGLPIKSELECTLLRVKPIKDLKNLYIIFQALIDDQDYRFHPFNYIAHLVGHESKGSILSLLKKRGLANGLTASMSGFGGSGFDFFQIAIELTDLGLEMYEDVILITMHYIKMMRENGIHEWIYEEIHQLNNIFFRFKEKSSPYSYTSSLAGNMHLYSPEHTLCGAYLMDEYKPELLRKCLDWLIVENLVVLLEANNSYWTAEKKNFPKLNWYDTVYSEESISEDLFKKLKSMELMPELHLPLPNKFLPEKFDIVPFNSPSTLKRHPLIALDNGAIRIWHRQDDRFSVPKANVALEIKSDLAYQTAQNCVFTNIFALLLKDALNEYAYYADVAGLEFSLDNSTSGLVLYVSGYSDKLSALLKEILSQMVSLSIEQDQFDRIRDQLVRKTKNWFQDAPHTHSIYYTTYFTQERLFTPEEKLEVLETLTLGQVLDFSKRLFDTCYVEGLVHGNLLRQDAIEFGNLIQSILLSKNPKCPKDLQTILLPEGRNFIVELPVFNPTNVNSAIEYVLQLGKVSDQEIRCKAALITHLAKEKAFTKLRTQEQLGYIVHTRTRTQTGILSFSLIIQSEQDPLYLESRIESFLFEFETYLGSMSVPDYQKFQDSLSKTYLEELKSLNQEFNRLWAHIQSGYFNFFQNELDGAKILEISKEELLHFFQSKINPSSKNRRKLSTHMQRQKEKRSYSEIQESEMNALLSSATIFHSVETIAQFKHTCELADLPDGDIGKFKQDNVFELAQ